MHPVALRVAVTAMPHRIALVTDAMRACGLADGTYKLYDYEVTVADGAARLADGTLAGSVLTMDARGEEHGRAGRPAGRDGDPAGDRSAGAHRRASPIARDSIERRYDADLVVLNDRFEVERVWATRA